MRLAKGVDPRDVIQELATKLVQADLALIKSQDEVRKLQGLHKKADHENQGLRRDVAALKSRVSRWKAKAQGRLT